MQKLAFPHYQFRLKNSENKAAIFDPLRKKFILLTPEEWVRQHVIQYFLKEKKIPSSHMSAEKTISVGDLTKRYDLVVFHPDGNIFIIVECKAPSVRIGQNTFDQIARYNLALKADFLMLTNGLQHYYCHLDYFEKRYHFLRDLPAWGRMS